MWEKFSVSNADATGMLSNQYALRDETIMLCRLLYVILLSISEFFLSEFTDIYMKNGDTVD